MNTYDFTVTATDGSTRSMSDYAGQVLLIVNVASRCGLTPQYEGLEKLHRDLADRGLQILGFPCNQFGNQEPGTEEEIQEFCSLTYDVTFPILHKIDVNGPDADPLYKYLRAEAAGSFGPENGRLYEVMKQRDPQSVVGDDVKWNFTKFLVGRDGDVIKRYESGDTPEQIGRELEDLL